MHERHENEQYFFDEPTLEHLTNFLSLYANPCCLCTPLLGKVLADRGVAVTILDTDERFSGVPGFRRYDLYRPEWIEPSFDVIICDPPFYNVSLSQLFDAIRKLSHFQFDQRLILAYLARRSESVKGTFHRFNLRNTGYFPGYKTVQDVARNKIELFSNLDDESTAKLRMMNASDDDPS